jgi:hypothetical protein
VSVTTPGGTSTNTANDDYTYADVPTIISVVPSAGPVAGGNTVLINGADFTGTTGVTFGGLAATNVSVVNDGQLSAAAPAHAAGTVDVVVTAPGGNTANTANDDYRYAPVPTVDSLVPTGGNVAGGNTVFINGTGLTGATAVMFGSSPATNINLVDDLQISATAPAGTGTVNVSVTTPSGTNANTANDDYTYFPTPTVTGLSPDQGPEAGGNSVTITGTGFTGTTGVQFAAAAATNVVVVNDTTITADAPAHVADSVGVRVTTPGGTSASNPPGSRYTYMPPTVTGVSPNEGPEAGGTSVTITGVAFTGTSSTGVQFAAAAATNVVVVNDTTITADAPAHVAGTFNVQVTTPSGTSVINPPVTRYTYVPAPTVTAVSPNAGLTSGDTPVTLTGTNFTAGSMTATVMVGANPCSSVVVVDATTITCTTPAGTAGTVNVTVTTNGGPSADNGTDDDYTYL